MYQRSGNTWNTGVTLTRPGSALDFGSSVALSGDGNTAVVGDAQGSGLGDGAATVYVRTSATGWSSGVNLTRPRGAGVFGDSVAVSSEGSVLVVGDSGAAFQSGAATVYLRTGNTWSSGFSLPRPSDVSRFGSAVAISGNGNAVWSAGIGTNGVVATLYMRAGNTWSNGAALSRPTGLRGYTDIALSSDGDTLVVGENSGIGDGNGALTAYVRSGDSWTSSYLTGAGPIADVRAISYVIALSSDGHTLAVGDDYAGGDGRGAVNIYYR